MACSIFRDLCPRLAVPVFLIFGLTTSQLSAQVYSDEDIRLVQRNLWQLGYSAGSVYGQFDDDVKLAIRAYESDWELSETGNISAELLSRLRREHPDTRPRMQRAVNQACEAENQRPRPRETLMLEGDCSSGSLQGKGKQVWRFFSQGKWQVSGFEGDFVDGRYHGRGLQADSAGSSYVGEFRNGMRDGRGVFTHPNGERYEGAFRNDRKNGQGTYLFANGNRYEGGWLDDRYHGQGVLSFASGSRYEGEFRKGKPHGKGVYFRKAGGTYSGTWSKGCFDDGTRRARIGVSKADCGFD